MSVTSPRAMGSHQSHRMGTDVWLTPPHILDALGPFDLDPCSSLDRPWDTARQHYTVEDDGLAQDWVGRVWCNPPYGQQAWTWLERLADHRQGTALIFARTETAGFFRTVWRRASALLFLEGRLHFHHPDGTRAPANAGAPSVLVAYGDYDAHRLATCGLPGAYVDLRPEVERLRALTALDDAKIERVARELAQLEPGEEWPTSHELGGKDRGKRDEEYRSAMREWAQKVINISLGEDEDEWI